MKILSIICSLLVAGSAACQAQGLPAWVVDMSSASSEDEASLRNISYEYNSETKIYTFHDLIEQGADVCFHDVNPNSNVSNIRFDNGAEEENSPFTWLLPNAAGENVHLIAVMSHFDYTSALHTFNTGFDSSHKKGHIVILDGSRSKVKRVIYFGAGSRGETIIEEVADIAAFKAKAKRSKSPYAAEEDRAQVYRISGEVTCIVNYQIDNSWYWVQDATGTLGIYINHSYPLGENHSYKAGDVLKGITGFSVGTEADGYQMELDEDQFYVIDQENHDASKEYTLFPAPSGTATVIAPTEVTKKSDISRSNNHDYVVLKDFTYEAESTETGNVYPARLMDSEGNYFDLTFDLTSYTNDNEDIINSFIEQVADRSTGNFTGFISNNAKNFTVSSWEITGTDGIGQIGTDKGARKQKFFVNRQLIITDGENHYNAQGTRKE